MHMLKAAFVLMLFAAFLVYLAAVDAKRRLCNEATVFGDNDD